MARNTKTYRFSPFGVGVHPWVNTPDAKFKPENPEFKLGLRCHVSDPLVADAVTFIRAQAEEALEAYLTEKEMKPQDRKKWTLYLPFDEEEDDKGNKTGYVVFKFRQNSKIKLRESGEVKDILVSIKDMQNKDSDVKVFGGAILRAAYSCRPNPSTSNKECGVRLDFAAVQVKDPGKRTGGGGGINFETGDGFVDDGFPDDDAPAAPTGGPAAPHEEY